jgi:hypothetical protein
MNQQNKASRQLNQNLTTDEYGFSQIFLDIYLVFILFLSVFICG